MTCVLILHRYEIEVWGELYDIERGDVLRSLECARQTTRIILSLSRA